MTEKESQKQLRLQRANALIKTISEHGRRFFRQPMSERVSRFELAGRLYFVDKVSDRRLPLSHTKSNQWSRYFSEGDTLKALVEALGLYIKTGQQINPHHLGPWPVAVCGGDLWGYGKSMQVIRDYAARLEIIKSNASRETSAGVVFVDIARPKGSEDDHAL